MSGGVIAAAVLAGLLIPPVSFLQLLYIEALRLRCREAPALERFKEKYEARLGLRLEEGAFLFSLVKQGLVLVLALAIFSLLPDPRVWRRMLEGLVLAWLAALVLAHLLPHFLYRRTSGQWLVVILPAARLTARASRPLLSLLSFLRSVAELSSPEEPREQASSPSEDIDALITAGAEEGLIEEGDRRLIRSVVEFGDKTVREVMTPRPNIVAIPEDATLEDLHRLVVQEQYSRIPVYRGSIDNITGFVHVRDLYELDEEIRTQRTVATIKRKIAAVPESKSVGELLQKMQKTGDHMAVVIDEYGHTAGLATMEDLVEEIVGEIRDEHEPEQDMVVRPDGTYVVSGNLDLDLVVREFSLVRSPDVESTTVGGLVTEWMGRVPRPGEWVERNGLRIEVLSSDERRVKQVRLMRGENRTENGE